jgi:calmodulin
MAASSDEIEQVLNDKNKFDALAKAAFETVDTDGSGALDVTELKQAMMSISGEVGCPTPSDSDVKSVLKELDADGSGTIELEEFKGLLRQILQLMCSQ